MKIVKSYFLAHLATISHKCMLQHMPDFGHFKMLMEMCTKYAFRFSDISHLIKFIFALMFIFKIFGLAVFLNYVLTRSK